MGLGPWEIIIIFIVILLVFGGKKLPELARGLGKGIKEFKKAQKELEEKGWYLVDHSNPERSFGVYIYLYT